MGKIVISHEELKENSRRHKEEFYGDLSARKKSLITTITSIVLGGAAVATSIALGWPVLVTALAGIASFTTAVISGAVLAFSSTDIKYSRYKEQYDKERLAEKEERKKLKQEKREEKNDKRSKKVEVVDAVKKPKETVKEADDEMEM